MKRLEEQTVECNNVWDILKYIQDGVKSDSLVWQIESWKFIDRILTWLIIGVVALPIVQAQHQIGQVAYATLGAIGSFMNIKASNDILRDSTKIWNNRYRYNTLWAVLVNPALNVPMIMSGTASYYLLVFTMSSLWYYKVTHALSLPENVLYADPDVRRKHNAMNSVLRSYSVTIAAVLAVVYMAIVPADKIIVVSACAMLVLNTWDAYVTHKWLKIYDAYLEEVS